MMWLDQVAKPYFTPVRIKYLSCRPLRFNQGAVRNPKKPCHAPLFLRNHVLAIGASIHAPLPSTQPPTPRIFASEVVLAVPIGEVKILGFRMDDGVVGLASPSSFTLAYGGSGSSVDLHARPVGEFAARSGLCRAAAACSLIAFATNGRLFARPGGPCANEMPLPLPLAIAQSFTRSRSPGRTREGSARSPSTTNSNRSPGLIPSACADLAWNRGLPFPGNRGIRHGQFLTFVPKAAVP